MIAPSKAALPHSVAHQPPLGNFLVEMSGKIIFPLIGQQRLCVLISGGNLAIGLVFMEKHRLYKFIACSSEASGHFDSNRTLRLSVIETWFVRDQPENQAGPVFWC